MMKNRNKKDEKSMQKVDEQSMKHRSKFDYRSTKIRSKFDQISIKIDQKSILEASAHGLATVKKKASGPPIAFLDAFWAALGAVWRRLGG